MSTSVDPGHANARALTPAQVDRVIVALQRATAMFRPTRFQAALYSVWRFTLWIAALSLIGVVAGLIIGLRWAAVGAPVMIAGTFGLLLSGAASLFLLLVNVPLIVRVSRRHWLLREAGLRDATRAIWKVETPWWRRTDRVFFALMACGYSACAWRAWRTAGDSLDAWFVFVAVLLLGMGGNIAAALFLQRKKEELEIVESAERVRAALERAAAGADTVPVSTALLETAARIEGAQIARERARAVAASSGEPRRYAIAFEPAAIAARAELAAPLRLALEDLLQRLAAHADTQTPASELLTGRSDDGRIQIQYSVDVKKQRISVGSVAALDTGSTPSGGGAA